MLMKRTIFYLVALFMLLPVTGVLHGQEGTAIKGTWMKPGEKEDPSFHWKASWIWLPKILDTTTALLVITGVQVAVLGLLADLVARRRG